MTELMWFAGKRRDEPQGCVNPLPVVPPLAFGPMRGINIHAN